MPQLAHEVQTRLEQDLKRADSDDPTGQLIAAIRGIATLFEADAITTLEASSRLSFLAAVALSTPAPFATCEQDGTEVYITMRRDGKFIARCSGNPQHITVMNV